MLGKDPHTLDRDEVFMVLAGTIQITPNGEKFGPGDAAVVLAGGQAAVFSLGETSAELQVAVTAVLPSPGADGSKLQPPWAQ
ncbi:hypothetical protein [Streptomyces sp. SID13031]|uniref:hypothetical protein n=1 Tax=Streptomyces sp. SID13031 TaxID=2706046 RepID=UPI0013CD42B1|nr:hypothetical protein [Streptomyces sp. SID13031]NEA31251.1 hypothetical protein [Streptomyces sp. SID13031]